MGKLLRTVARSYQARSAQPDIDPVQYGYRRGVARGLEMAAKHVLVKVGIEKPDPDTPTLQMEETDLLYNDGAEGGGQ